MLNKKGFTLVELLGVIIILAVILIIAVPNISGVVKNSTKTAFASDAKTVLEAINLKLLEDVSFVPSTVNETNVKSLLDLDDSNYERLMVKEASGSLYVTIVGQNKWEGLTVSGTKDATHVENTVDTFIGGANAPVLAPNMVPIKWVDGACVEEVCAEGTWEDTTTTDSEWYNYDTTNKRWANAKTADGSFWVWIPRYVYKISGGWNSATTGTIDIQFTKGVDDNWNKGEIGDIDLSETASASNSKWTNHPAFTFGDTELRGIWVAKFKPTASEGVQNAYNHPQTACPIVGDNVTNKTVKIIPNAMPWRCIEIGNAFTVSRNMETNAIYGWGTTGNGIDTHLLKATEWGAVVYLSKSVYGQNTNEIWINSDRNVTGCAGDSATSGPSSGCVYPYNTSDGVKASTTGTIYGVYDMVGVAWETLAAYLDEPTNTNITTYGASVLNAPLKYKDVYTKSATSNEADYALMINKKGDAMYETSTTSDAWFEGCALLPNIYAPWLTHSLVCGAFGYVNTTGKDYAHTAFRPALLVNEGL